MQQLKSRLWKYKYGMKPLNWFKFDSRVRFQLVPNLSEENIPEADFVFATAFQTAEWVTRYSKGKGRKFYLVQSYEDWHGDEKLVKASWLLPLHKVVVSKWLAEIARDFGEEGRTTYIPPGLDFEQFKILNPIHTRSVPRVGMLLHPHPIKGAREGVAALEMVKSAFSNLEAVLFGTEMRFEWLPNWVEYVRLPDPERLCTLYNSCQIFLHPSWVEGWPLPPAEAMACGCALVAAANPGVRDYAEHGVTAMLAEVKNPLALAERVKAVLTDPLLRQRLAETGCAKIAEFTWERAANVFEQLLLSEAPVAHEVAGIS